MLGHQSIRNTERDRALRRPPRKARYLRTSTAFEIGREVDGAEDNFRDNVFNTYIGRKVRRRLELGTRHILPEPEAKVILSLQDEPPNTSPLQIAFVTVGVDWAIELRGSGSASFWI